MRSSIIYSDTEENLLDTMRNIVGGKRVNIAIFRLTDTHMKLGLFFNGRFKVRRGKVPMVSKLLTLSVRSLVEILKTYQDAIETVGTDDPWICVTNLTEAKK